MEVFVVYVGWLRQNGFYGHSRLQGTFRGGAQLLIPLQIVFVELLLCQVKRLGEFDGDFLLLEEDKLVVLHVFLGVRFQVRAQLVQVQTVLVIALLVVQEKLTELGRAKGSSNHAVIQDELIDCQNGYGAFPR